MAAVGIGDRSEAGTAGSCGMRGPLARACGRGCHTPDVRAVPLHARTRSCGRVPIHATRGVWHNYPIHDTCGSYRDPILKGGDALGFIPLQLISHTLFGFVTCHLFWPNGENPPNGALWPMSGELAKNKIADGRVRSHDLPVTSN